MDCLLALFNLNASYFDRMNNHSTTPTVLPQLRARQIAQATLFIVMVGVAFWLLLRFRDVIFILFIAIVLSTAITPAVDWLYRRGVPRAVGVILMYLLITAFVIGFLLLAAPLILNQVTNVVSNIPGYYQAIEKTLTNSSSYFIRQLAYVLPPQLQLFPTTPAQPAQQENQMINQVNMALGYAGTLAHAIFIGVAIFLLAFYWTLDGERTIRSLLLFVSSSARDNIRDIIGLIQGKVGGFILSQLILCATIGLFAGIAYLLIGIPNALLLGLIAAVFEAVPIFGPILGALPAVLITLSLNSTTKLVLVIVATNLIQFAENHFLVPRLVGKSVGVNPVVTLLALAAFTSLFGLAGALVAIPLAAIAQILI
ncbi:MAG: AI-2E family transporter, partial [Omnitrophica WOR_2 bacterium]